MDLISIITATLNRTSLKYACESIDAQTYKDWHHYVIGDGVAPIDYRHSRRTTLGFSRTVGADEPGANMPDGTPNPILRWALRHLALETFVCFLDDDNLYRPTYLEKMVSALNSNPKVGIAICGVEDLRYGQELDGYPEYGRCDNSGFLARSRIAKTIEFPCATMEKEVIQDCEFIQQCAADFGWIHVPEKLVVFGAHPNTPSMRGKIRLLESWERPLRAAQFTRAGNYERAITELASFAESDPSDAWSLWHLGEAYFFAGETNAGRRAWARWIELASQEHGLNHDWIRFCLALASLTNNHGVFGVAQLSLALEMSDSRAVLEPNNSDNGFNRGLYRLVNGSAGEAFEAYRSTASRHPPQKHIKEAIWKLKLLAATELQINGIKKAIQILESYSSKEL